MRTAITGGIGSGKSYVCRMLSERGIEVFNCDIVAKTIIATHPEVRRQLEDLVGSPLTRQSLGDYIRADASHAARVNAIVHPRVAEAFVASGLQWMECAILFESGFDRLVDRVVVVTCPEEERIRRIIQRDGCSRETALRWLALQMTDDERLARAVQHAEAWAAQHAEARAAQHAEARAAQHAGQASTLRIINDGATPLDPQLDTLLNDNI